MLVVCLRCWCLFVMFDGCCCCLFRVVVYAWRLSSSCLCVFMMCFAYLLLMFALRVLLVLFARFDGFCCDSLRVVMYA